jgi:hypothetical protein
MLMILRVCDDPETACTARSKPNTALVPELGAQPDHDLEFEARRSGCNIETARTRKKVADSERDSQPKTARRGEEVAESEGGSQPKLMRGRIARSILERRAGGKAVHAERRRLKRKAQKRAEEECVTDSWRLVCSRGCKQEILNGFIEWDGMLSQETRRIPASK